MGQAHGETVGSRQRSHGGDGPDVEPAEGGMRFSQTRPGGGMHFCMHRRYEWRPHTVHSVNAPAGEETDDWSGGNANRKFFNSEHA